MCQSGVIAVARYQPVSRLDCLTRNQQALTNERCVLSRMLQTDLLAGIRSDCYVNIYLDRIIRERLDEEKQRQ